MLGRKALLPVGIAIAMAFVPVVAVAQPGDPGAPQVERPEAEMVVADIDEEVAARAGNRVVTDGDHRVLIDGSSGAELARVPASPSAPSEPRPFSSVQGDCGTSYFWMADRPGNEYEFWTGFELLPGRVMIDFNWYVTIEGSDDSGAAVDHLEWERHGPHSGDSWLSGIQVDTHYAPSGSNYYGRVTWGEAIMTDGTICVAGYPTDGRRLYS